MPTQVRIDRSAVTRWNVTFDNPPMNLIDPGTIRELVALVTELETDPDVRVVVFDSADPDFFLAHYDISRDPSETTSMPADGPTGMHPWLDFLVRISNAPVASIVKLRGRARGAGSEFVLACDMRFASRERAVLAQLEVGLGLVAGGDPMHRLPFIVGRGRALEIMLTSQDFDGELAERYGYVNRALPDAELDDFVDRIADRIASFDKIALAETKRCVGDVSLPDPALMPPVLDEFWASVAREGAQRRLGKALEPRPAATNRPGAEHGRLPGPRVLAQLTSRGTARTS
ncbi:enoyl-CoA hydratase/isomerase family protein [Pseudonocardia spinosispora]|uniref:enoyl-CoA hydratase/isomerase family protein n=1 Tax=Pseudonocardia spinosispora TaxID=103441 RepID=UPI0003F68CCB|nr:enoyl-CoA hydratase/isomerase family protein [Pseudonocardia spinosispora]